MDELLGPRRISWQPLQDYCTSPFPHLPTPLRVSATASVKDANTLMHILKKWRKEKHVKIHLAGKCGHEIVK